MPHIATNASSSSNYHPSSAKSVPIKPQAHSSGWQSQAENLGYGIGRLISPLVKLWKSYWDPPTSPADIVHQNRFNLGLTEATKHLEHAIENLHKNPRDPHNIKHITQLAELYQQFIIPANDEALRTKQNLQFKNLQSRFSLLPHALQIEVNKLVPILCTNHQPDCTKNGSTEGLPLKKRDVVQMPTPAPFGPVFNLSGLNGSNGFAIPGIASGGELGRSARTIGDVNGDNIADLVLGAWLANSNNGVSYVIFGSHSPFPAVFNLNSLDGSHGFSIPAIVSGAELGLSASPAGDMNGDGISDLALAANGVSGNSEAYVIFGSRSTFSPVFDLYSLNGSNGFTIPVTVGSGYYRISTSTAGDVNGDNIADLLLGAPYANGGYGISYVIFGSQNNFQSIFNLGALNGSNGFSIPGTQSGGGLGIFVNTAGDMNGDNITDLVLGAFGENSGNGACYVIFGSRSSFPAIFNLNSLNGSNGFSVPGIVSGGYLGNSVATAGDVNGDTIADLVLGAYAANALNGASYVIFGNRNSFPAVLDLNSLNGSNGFSVPGIVSGGSVGGAVNTAGDLNGDNIADLVLGANYANSGTGISYVIFGSRSGFQAVFDLNTLNGSNGFNIPGIISGGNIGGAVSTAGDVNGDNIIDLVLGAPNANSNNGTAYVIFGRNTLPSSTPTPTSIPIPAPTQAPAPVQMGTIDWVIQANGTTVLTASQFQVIGNSTQLASDIFTVDMSQGGYFVTKTNLTEPLTNFTYPQIQAGEILFVHNGTALPKITLSIGDGSGEPILFSPLVSFSNDNSPSNPSPSLLRIAAGAAAGAVSFAALLTAVGMAAHHRRAKEKEREKAAASPVRNLASVATPLQRKGN